MTWQRSGADAHRRAQVTHIVCEDDSCAARAGALRAAARATDDVPLLRRAWLSDSVRDGALHPLSPDYIILSAGAPPPQPPETPARAPPGAAAAKAVAGGDASRCATCGRPLPESCIARCLRCMAREPAAARCLFLRYRAAHPHNRPVVAAMRELYEYEVRC